LGGEIQLGLDQEQSEITLLFGIYTLVAAIIEEVIFRGYIVINDRGPVAR
jgi:membrane protease YdiL (CAAX protease family)